MEARKDQAVLRILDGAVSDTAIQGLVNDWIAPMIVDHIIESITGYNANADLPSRRGNYAYNNFGRTAHDDKASKRRTATKTSSPEANAETAADVDAGGAQRAERICGATESDGQ